MATNARAGTIHTHFLKVVRAAVPQFTPGAFMVDEDVVARRGGSPQSFWEFSHILLRFSSFTLMEAKVVRVKDHPHSQKWTSI